MKLKAYRVDNPGSWSTLVYAETAGRARMIDFREYHDGDFDDVLAMRVVRVPVCDGFAPDTPVIDDDPIHQMLAGIMQECYRCSREIHEGDRWGYSVPPTILCGSCLDEWEAA